MTSQKIINNKCSCKWQRIKKSVRKKYNYTCQICGKKDNNITVHHKLPVRDIKMLYNLITIEEYKKCKLLWDRNWLIPLCKKCENIIDNPVKNRSFTEEYTLNKRRIL